MSEGKTELSGTTLRVYIYMLKASKPVGVREVQRAMGFKSPSTALYHITKLLDQGLVVKDEDGYRAIGSSSVSSLLMFKRIGRVLVPRFLFYAVFFTSATAMFTALSLIYEGLRGFPWIFALAMCLIASAIMWIETFRLWRRGVT
ncbi:MAG: hypothetical protein DRJ68_06535 [Thermoprotei archaeon]|nr:MAG: hypothetical protein DRJ68_06535 [Thermoprotei archaeon]